MTSNLLYLMDPLCAWCYTFAGRVEQLMREYPDDLVLEIVPWGMFPSPRPAGTISPALSASFICT